MNILKAATSECLADEAGIPGPEYLSYYARILQTQWLDGAMTGHIIVCPEARPEAGNVYFREGRLGWSATGRRGRESTHLSSDEDDHAEEHRYQAYVRANAELLHELSILAKNCPPGKVLLPQINHGGRQIPRSFLKKTGATEVLSPFERGVSQALGIFATPTNHLGGAEDQNVVICQFAFACRALTEVSGFPGVQIHMAHGYLLNDMLDCGRYAFLARLLTTCRAALGGKLMSVKICFSREICDVLLGLSRGQTSLLTTEAWEFCRVLDSAADLIEISAGSYSHPTFAQAWKNPDSVFGLPYAQLWSSAFAFAFSQGAEGAGRASGIEFHNSAGRSSISGITDAADTVLVTSGPSAARRARVMVTGRIRSREQARYVLQEHKGVVDCVGMARLFCLPEPENPQAPKLVRRGIPVSALVKHSLKICAHFLPLATAGPNTAFWRECLRNVASGRIQKNEQTPCVIRPNIVRWCIDVLKCAIFGEAMGFVEEAEVTKCMQKTGRRRGTGEVGEQSPVLSGLSSPAQGSSQ